MNAQSEAHILEMMARYKKYPSLWVEEVIGIEPTPQQTSAFNAFAEDGAKISIKSGVGVGKSAFTSWIILHTLFFFDNVKIPVTAPTGKQVKDIIFAECRKWLAKMDPWWSKQIRVTRERIFWVDSKGNPGSREALCRTSRPEQPEALAGIHEDNVVYVIEEATGCPEAIFPTIRGALSTPNAKIIMISNPTRTDGFFWESHVKNEDGAWQCFTFSGIDSPLVTEKFIQDTIKEYGEDSDEFRIRVLGEFPEGSHDVYIKRQSVESAYYREVQYDDSRKIAGLDVARFGDDACALVVRQGKMLIHLQEWRGKDTTQTAGIVRDAHRNGLFDIVFVDAIGVGGGVADQLKEMGVPVVGVNVAESSSSKQEFYRLRDELWDRSKRYWESLTCGVNNDLVDKEQFDRLVGELCMVRYDYMGSKLKMESKSDMKKRGVKSPNLADAFNNTFANDVTGAAGITDGVNNRARPINRSMNHTLMGLVVEKIRDFSKKVLDYNMLWVYCNYFRKCTFYGVYVCHRTIKVS